MTTETTTYRLWTGDARTQMAALPSQSVQCVITSPPYFGLRSYLEAGHASKQQEIGTEPTPPDYIQSLVAVFQEIRRVLRPDGTVWVNVGDSYSRGMRPHAAHDALRGRARPQHARIAGRDNMGYGTTADRPSKNLLLIPSRFALAMQDAGWILRSDIIWHKPNALPESVQDRPTGSYEHVFLFVQSDHPRLWVHRDRPYSEAITQKPAPDYRWIQTDTGEERSEMPDEGERNLWRRINLWRGCDYYYDAEAMAEPTRTGGQTEASLRNRRDVWNISTGGSQESSHCAVFPAVLISPMILAGSRPGDIVLDPFAGSGTTLWTANHLGRHAWGIELNPAYADAIEQRMAGQLAWVL